MCIIEMFEDSLSHGFAPVVVFVGYCRKGAAHLSNPTDYGWGDNGLFTTPPSLSGSGKASLWLSIMVVTPVS
jgi:hypothetical protein